VTSGIRLGTAALTTRGMKEDDMRVIGKVMVDILNHPDDEKVTADCNARIAELCQKHPLYPDVE
jgi:glycine hydroxymethyltransferase